MGKAVLAVFDSSREYVDRFLAYVKKKKNLPFEVVAFTDDQILAEYLSRNKVRILLYSQEEMVDEQEAEDTRCEKYIGHPNVGEFLYLGKRRNSRSRLRHINKYQSMETILEELLQIMDFSGENQDIDHTEGPTVFGIYTVSPGFASLQTALRITASCAASTELLYINLDRFSLLDQVLPIEKNGSISDLIYFYRINKDQIKETLRKTKESRNGFDLLGAPLDMEDLDAITEEEWPDFLHELSNGGEYDTVILDMHEAFRDLEKIFSLCSRIYVISDDSGYAKEKVKKMTESFRYKAREDLIRKMTKIGTEER